MLIEKVVYDDRLDFNLKKFIFILLQMHISILSLALILVKNLSSHECYNKCNRIVYFKMCYHLQSIAITFPSQLPTLIKHSFTAEKNHRVKIYRMRFFDLPARKSTS